jgi:putative oxidoreductase
MLFCVKLSKIFRYTFSQSRTKNMHSTDLGKLILRLTLGILILMHGIAKITGGVGSVTSGVANIGLPPALGYLVYVGEVLAPLMLIVGVWSRIAAAIIAINMVAAIYLVHMGQLFTLSKSGGWALELQGMYLFTAIALILLGAGRFSLGKGSRWN